MTLLEEQVILIGMRYLLRTGTIYQEVSRTLETLVIPAEMEQKIVMSTNSEVFRISELLVVFLQIIQMKMIIISEAFKTLEVIPFKKHVMKTETTIS